VSRKAHSYPPWVVDTIRVLGRQITAERRDRRWTQERIAERVGISVGTLASVERGSTAVAIGTVFEVAAFLGIKLVGATEPMARHLIDSRLALLPSRVREPKDDDGDF
jgi:transcriptional regulator with XRE-family HTH domain